MGVIFKNNVIYGAGDIEISPVCYSEEEREVGCWIDGKPLYQKTWTGLTITPQYNVWTNLFQVTNIDKIIDWGARDTGTCCLNGTGLELTYDSSSSNYIKAEYTQNSNVRQIGTLTLQYTKTTDTPGSGKYAPSGVPAVHYSENEHVVGTWIDGNTLYEQTIYVENPTKSSTSGYYYYNAFSTATDIDFATLLNATIYDATDGRWLDLPHERIISSETIQIQGMVVNHSYQFQVFFRTNQSYNITKMIATIRYTKTTS